MNNLPEYVLFEPIGEIKDKVLILQTAPPYVMGQVWRFRTGEEMNGFMERNADNSISLIAGHRMLIAYYGNLEEFKLHPKQITDALQGMRDYFTKERVEHEKYKGAYKKYKIDT